MKAFEESKWIWLSGDEEIDSYAEFIDKIEYFGEKVTLNLSADTDYVIFVNGNYVASNQYGDFEHYKIYDTVDITDHLKVGKNLLTFLVYHNGSPTSRYRPYAAGLIYEAVSSGKVICASSAKTLSRKEPHYVSGRRLMITCQLGYSFSYDSTAKDDIPYLPSRVVDKSCCFFPRPIKKQRVLSEVTPSSMKKLGEGHYLIDLGREVVGLPSLRLNSSTEQNIRVAWGEHLEDGGVRITVGGRNFYYEYRARAGENAFSEFMLRIGCRYIETFAERDFELVYAGVMPEIYEVDEAPVEIDGELDRRIYELSVNTLKLSMMEHYVDCPWREQALYVFDSRNQMLFGYYAFKDGNCDYVKSNLKLIAEDRRDDGLLSICYPCGVDLCIPSFSIYYGLSVNEYLHFSGDVDFVKSVLPKIEGILDDVLAHRCRGLIERYEGENYWNFYDWSAYLEGNHGGSDEAVPDLMLNCLTILSLIKYRECCETVGVGYKYGGVIEELREKVKGEFLTDDGVFTMLRGKKQYTALGNAMAILSGTVRGEEADALAERLIDGSLSECSLSMKELLYEALLSVDERKYAPVILEEVRKNYKIMLDYGADTTWETIDGAAAFDNAGSLCHGWTAVPIYVYHRLGIAKYKNWERK